MNKTLKHKSLSLCGFLLLSLVWAGSSPTANAVDAAGKKKIVLVAGPPSHGPGEHEHNACVLLLKKCLDQVSGVLAVAHLNGWPKDVNAFAGADTVLFEMDGGYAIFQGDRPKLIGELMQAGVGLICVHLAVEVGKNKGGPEFLDWIGGSYEPGYSINPDWTAEIRSIPDHPITRGVQPFSILDEWYFNLRFRPQMKGITPILVAIPSDEIRDGKTAKPPGARAHIVAAKGRAEVLAWAFERADAGRSFGFTGGHFHRNWGNDNFRKVMLNAILWTAKIDVPAQGVASAVTSADLAANLDPKAAPKRPAAPAALAAPAVTQKFSENIQERLPQKAQILQAKVQEWRQAGKDLQPVGKIMQEFEPLIQAGNLEEAEKLLDKALALVGEKAPAASAAPGNPQERIQQKAQRVQAGIQKWAEEGRDPSAVGAIVQEAGSFFQEGKLKEGEAKLNEALKLLEGKEGAEKESPSGSSSGKAEVGQPAPEFTATGIFGKTHRLSEYKGKIVVLEAMNLDCPFSANQYKTGAMQVLQEELGKQGIIWLTVNSCNRQSGSYRESGAAQKEFTQHKMKAAAWIDDSSGAVGRLYGMKTTPHLFVINKDGLLVYDGAIDDKPVPEGDPRKARNYVREAVSSLLAGQPVKVSQTKPYGCAVKY